MQRAATETRAALDYGGNDRCVVRVALCSEFPVREAIGQLHEYRYSIGPRNAAESSLRSGPLAQKSVLETGTA
jgi:hypothetical protein